MNYTEILCSCALALATILQTWILANQHRLLRLPQKTQHYIELKSFWNKFTKYIDYIYGYKAQFNIPSVKTEIISLLQDFNNHTDYTACYFSKKLTQKEKILVEQINNICSVIKLEASIYNFEPDDFDNLFELYKEVEMLYRQELK